MIEPKKRDEAPCDYTKKPVTIQAIEWTGDNLRAVIDFTGLNESATKWTWKEYEQVVKKDGLKIFTLEGPMMASVGDYIIRGVKGEFYACKPDIFAATYSASAQSAETQEAEEQAWAECKAERIDDSWTVGETANYRGFFKLGYDAALRARLASKPSRSEADETRLAIAENTRLDMLKKLPPAIAVKMIPAHIMDVWMVTYNHLARPSREEEMREALNVFVVYSVSDEDYVEILGAYRTEDEAESARNEFGAEVDDEDVVEIWIESTKLAALAQGGARDEGEKQ